MFTNAIDVFFFFFELFYSFLTSGDDEHEKNLFCLLHVHT